MRQQLLGCLSVQVGSEVFSSPSDIRKLIIGPLHLVSAVNVKRLHVH
jgi:hypothetical protein